jgi:uncharacterized peroxidase-related enzyme
MAQEEEMRFRLPPVDPATAKGEAREVLERARRKRGAVSNLDLAMANSPAALRGYLDLRAALAGGRLPGLLREQLALLVAEQNGSRYCVSWRTCRAVEAGLAPEELAAARRAESADPKTAAALSFAAAVLDSRGWVTDRELERVRAAGFSDGEITEIIAHVALNCFANFFCQVVQPEPEFAPIALTTDEVEA